MTVRNRMRNSTSLASGYYWTNPGMVKVNHSASYGRTEVCDDVVGNPTASNPLRLKQTHTFIPVLNGTTPGIGSSPPPKGHVDNPLGSGVIVAPPDPLTPYPSPNGLAESAMAWKILAETNPSAPIVSMPTMMAELKDLKELPLRVRDWGGSLLAKVAQGHLTWRWAIKPLMRELATCFNFAEASERRFRELWNLSQNGKGYKLRKRVGLGRSTATTVTNSVLRHSEGFLLNYRRTRTDTIEEWGSSQWGVSDTSVLPKKREADYVEKLRKLTFDTFYGLTSYEYLATAWELCPWSWFIDWFSDVGDIINGANNTIGLNWSSVCWMRKITSRYDYELITALPTGYSVSGVPFEAMVRKERRVVSPAIAVSPSFLPVLTNSQWSILGSLAALKIEGRSIRYVKNRLGPD